MTLTIPNVFRKAGVVSAFLLTTCLPGWGQSLPVTCVTAAAGVNIRAGAGAERVADLVVSCTGGTPTPNGENVQPMTWTLQFATNVTSRQLAPGWSDALLVVDEPAVGNQFACATTNGLCNLTGTGDGITTYLGPGRPNVYQAATDLGTNVLVWRGVPFDPPGPNRTRTFRFTNLRVPALGLQAGTTIAAQVAVSGQIPASIAISNRVLATVRAVGSVSLGSIEAVGGRLTKFTLSVTELFANALKAASADGPQVMSPQADPGGVTHDYELGFFNPEFPTTSRGALAFAGLPDTGTRLRIRLIAVPSSFTVAVPLTVNFGSTGQARLVSTDSNGLGSYVPAQSGTLANSAGNVIAVYEIAQSSPAALETVQIPFTLAAAPGAPVLQTLDLDLSLAPMHPSQTGDSGPIPRFNSTSTFRVQAPLDPLNILTTSLLPGVVGAPYSQTIEAAGGLLPYTFTSVPAFPAPGLVLQSNGVLSGTPTVAGTFSFAVTLRDAAQSTQVRNYSLTIGAAGSGLQTSVSKLDFTALPMGSPPPSQVFRVTAPQAGQSYSVVVDPGVSGAPAPAWITVSPLGGGIPGLVTVSVNPGSLGAGTYAARILVSVVGNPNLPAVAIPVTLTVRAEPPKLESSHSLLQFSMRAAAPGRKQATLILRNSGTGNPIAFTSAVVQRSSWITSLSPASGNAGALGAAVRVNIDSAGLAEGIYRDVLRFTSSVNNVDVPVILRVTPGGPYLDVDQTGVRFTMRENARTLAVREIKVMNREPGTTLNWTAELIRGAEYFAIAGATGIASTGTPGYTRLSVRAETVGLPAGSYYGLLRVTAAGANYSPRYVTVVLQVKPFGQTPDLDVSPGGLVLTGLARSSVRSQRNIIVNAATTTAVPFEAAASTVDGGNWLRVTPGTGGLSSAGSEIVSVTANPGELGPGIYQGEVTIATADASETVPVLYIVTDGAAGEPGRRAACTPNRAAVGTVGLTNHFTVPAGWPAALTVEVRDNCGTALAGATVVARFSNGDPPMTLEPDDVSGVYSGTWQPGVAAEQTNVTISALTSEYPEAKATLVGSVRENKVPVLFRNGTIHNLDPKLGGLLSPGLVAQVYGAELAAVAESTGAVPLVTTYKNTTVLVGPYEAPLYYVSPGQLVVQLPSELPPNRSYPILVSANGAITVPDNIDVVAVQPGVAAFPDGRIIAQHADFRLVDAANPARRGEFLIMYLVGLGATNPSVASGQPSPGTPPLAVPQTQTTVTIDGAPAETVFIGLTPSGVGLYQINFKVPENARLNTPLDVVVRQGGYTSNVTQLTVVP